MTGAVRCNKKVELWGDRPSALAIDNESKKIQKGFKKPVILYVVSPKTIHVEASEFMALVQQLTGLASPPAAAAAAAAAAASASDGSSDGSRDDADAGARRVLPVKVKARVLDRQGAASILPSVFRKDLEPQVCEGAKEGDLMESDDWFRWGEYY